MRVFSAKAKDPSRELRAALEGRSILCVSDDKYVLAMRKHILKAFGCAVLTSEVHHAIALLKDQKVDVDAVIFDRRTPGTDGGLWAINLRMARPDVPIILVTKGPIDVSDTLKKVVSLVLPETTPYTTLLQGLSRSLQPRRARRGLLAMLGQAAS